MTVCKNCLRCGMSLCMKKLAHRILKRDKPRPEKVEKVDAEVRVNTFYPCPTCKSLKVHHLLPHKLHCQVCNTQYYIEVA